LLNTNCGEEAIGTPTREQKKTKKMTIENEDVRILAVASYT
jgi:hypothetical protein